MVDLTDIETGGSKIASGPSHPAAAADGFLCPQLRARQQRTGLRSALPNANKPASGETPWIGVRQSLHEHKIT
jgi:hypothetical protein